MKINYDSKVDVLYLEFAEGNYKISRKISESVIVDEDKKGKVLGIEILDAKKNITAFDPNNINISVQSSQ